LATAGSQIITVTDGSISATTTAITVNTGAIYLIQIAPGTATVAAGSKQTYTAKASDYYGNSWDITSLTSYSITLGAGGSWSTNTYTSCKSGIWTVIGSYLNTQGSASLTINPSSATSITINPTAATIVAVSSEAFTATASDSCGNTWDLTSTTGWSISSDTEVHGLKIFILHANQDFGQ
jgi:hypothetical protein